MFEENDLWIHTDFIITKKSAKHKKSENSDFINEKDESEFTGRLIPISYKQLQNYGLSIQSERASGIKNWESSYEVVYSDKKLDIFEKEVLHKSILVGCPEFIKIYMEQKDNDKILVILRKERNNKKEIEFEKSFKIKFST